MSTMRYWLRELRRGAKLTQAEAASRLGISRQAYNFIENGERCADMGLSLMRGISQLFGVSLDDIARFESRR